MNRSCLIPFAAACLLATNAWAQTSVGVSIGINQPGVYGRIDIGNVPQPALVYVQPVVIAPPRVAVAPVYLYVPPGHQKNWAKHCARYDACGRPVYFVKEEWVRQRYEEQQHHAQGKQANQGNQGNNGGKKNKNH
jgi:hypothetical protein